MPLWKWLTAHWLLVCKIGGSLVSVGAAVKLIYSLQAARIEKHEKKITEENRTNAQIIRTWVSAVKDKYPDENNIPFTQGQLRDVLRKAGRDELRTVPILFYMKDNGQARHIRNVRAKYVQADEIRCFVGKKDKHVRVDDPPEYGNQWVFVTNGRRYEIGAVFRSRKENTGNHVCTAHRLAKAAY